MILVGEWHTHAGIHRFQTDLFKQMTEKSHPMALSMEQFTREAQPLMDYYLTGKIGDQYPIQRRMLGLITKVITALWSSLRKANSCP